MSEPSLSKEQQQAASPGTGFRIVVANAGSGKTTTGGELFRRLFRMERGRLFPGGRPISADEVKGLLGLFFFTSFTVKQAADLDRKIKEILRQEGMPIPMRDGKEVRICRTLDSHLQSWLRKRMFFHRWCGLNNAWPSAFARLMEYLPADARERLRVGKDDAVLDGRDQVLQLYYKMSPMLVGDFQTMVAQCLVRTMNGPRIEMKLTPNVMLAGFRSALGKLQFADENWGKDYWSSLIAIWRADHERHAELYTNLNASRLKAEGPPEADSARQLATAWWRSTIVAERFLNLYQIARTRGYDPLFNPRFLGSQPFLEAFASAEGMEDESVATFHAWATAYARFKLDAGLLDFGDCLEAYVRVLSLNQNLLEPNRGYPRFGYRFLYCVWDEGQDFTPRQMRLVKLMAPPPERPGMTMMLGDGKQSLYLFAGASPYEFTRLVKELRSAGDNVYTLTTSFRSARRIVALGNEVAATLPSYAASVIPSTPAYQEAGDIVVSPPLLGEEDEATWILKRIDALLSAGESEIMVVFRNDPAGHPLSPLLRDPKYRSIDLLTIHRSKGLEAKHVFVGGCTAGRFPVPIGDTLGRTFDERAMTAGESRRLFNDQECNLVYVAATRARWSLTFSIPVMMRVNAGAGATRDERTGPSPIFWELPTLRQLCLQSGWREEDLKAGVAAHEKKVDTFYQRFHGRIFALNEEAKKLGLKPGVDTGEAKDREDTAALGVHELLREKGASRNLSGAPRKPVSSGKASNDSVLAKLRAGFFCNGKPPSKMNTFERDLAFREGWLEMGATGVQFSPTFKGKFRVS